MAQSCQVIVTNVHVRHQPLLQASKDKHCNESVGELVGGPFLEGYWDGNECKLSPTLDKFKPIDAVLKTLRQRQNEGRKLYASKLALPCEAVQMFGRVRFAGLCSFLPKA